MRSGKVRDTRHCPHQAGTVGAIPHPLSLCFGDPPGPATPLPCRLGAGGGIMGSNDWRRMSQAQGASVSLIAPTVPRARWCLQGDCYHLTLTRAKPRPLSSSCCRLRQAVPCGAGQGLTLGLHADGPQLSARQGRPFKDALKTSSKCPSAGAQRYEALPTQINPFMHPCPSSPYHMPRPIGSVALSLSATHQPSQGAGEQGRNQL